MVLWVNIAPRKTRKMVIGVKGNTRKNFTWWKNIYQEKLYLNKYCLHRGNLGKMEHDINIALHVKTPHLTKWYCMVVNWCKYVIILHGEKKTRKKLLGVNIAFQEKKTPREMALVVDITFN